jgi:hypothetical protein
MGPGERSGAGRRFIGGTFFGRCVHSISEKETSNVD